MNGPGAAGMAVAASLAGKLDWTEVIRSRDELERGILASIPEARILASATARLPNTTCVVLPGADSATLLDRLDARGFAVASGSACTTGIAEPSHVLLAMGIPAHEAHATLRVSMGPTTTREELLRFLPALVEETAAVRSRSTNPVPVQ